MLLGKNFQLHNNIFCLVKLHMGGGHINDYGDANEIITWEWSTIL